jgi:hypothetical protein
MSCHVFSSLLFSSLLFSSLLFSSLLFSSLLFSSLLFSSLLFYSILSNSLPFYSLLETGDRGATRYAGDGDRVKREETREKRTESRKKWLGDTFYTIDWLLRALFISVSGFICTI